MMKKGFQLLFAGNICMILLFVCISNSTSGASNINVPIIRSFDFSGSGLRTNWSIVQDKRGVMFFGVQGGILEFNNVEGSNIIWLPNGSTVRSMCTDENGIVYVGARQEFGFLKPDERGALVYESLVEKLDSADRNFSEVAKVYATPDGICFQSFEALYFYKNGKFKIVKSSSSFHFSFYINNVLYVLERGVGLDKYENGRLSLVKGGDAFADVRIYSILPLSKTKLLVATRESGLFLYDLLAPAENNITEVGNEINDLLTNSQIYDGVQMKDSTIVYGTLQGGLILLTKNLEFIKTLNKANLLDDDKVNDLYIDNYGDLWLAQDNHVSIIELNTPFTLIKDRSGINGNIQSICKFGKQVYIATTLGAYSIDPQAHLGENSSNPHFTKLDLQAECFNFLDVKWENENKLFLCSPLGFYEVKDQHLEPIVKDYCFFAFQSKASPENIILGLKNGFALLSFKKNKWQVFYPDNNIKDEIKSIAEDSLGNIWLATMKSGIYKLNSRNLSNINTLGTSSNTYLKYDTTQGLPDMIYNKVFAFNTGVLFGTKEGLYAFDFQKKRFYPYQELNSLLDKSSSQIIDFTVTEKNQIVVLSVIEGSGPLVSIIEKDASGKYVNHSKPFRRIGEYIVTALNIKGDDKLWMSSTNSIFCADLNVVKAYAANCDRKYNVLIRSVQNGNDSILFSGTFFEIMEVNGQSLRIPVKDQPKGFIPKIEYANNQLIFNFSYSFNEPSSYNYYSYYLEGYEKTWNPWTLDSKVSYNNLSEGTYRLHLKAKNIYDTESDETVYQFVILPPWYRTIWAYISYTFLFAGFVFLVVQLSVGRLKRAKLVLENTVRDRTSEIVKQSEEIQKQKNIVEIKNKDITDSINYAKRIQDTILPPDKEIKAMLPNCFILFMPKDILSGDFYWLDEIDNKTLVAAVDCTGHGVPGALMSIVGNNILSQSINEHRLSQPSEILDELNKGVTNTLRQKNEESKVKDGMDIVLLALDKNAMKLEFAGANNPLYHIRNGVLNEIKGDKFPIGIFIGEELKHFTNHNIQLQKGDTIYLFTDGYADQFGGPQGKKFKYNQFKNTLLNMQAFPMESQREHLLKTINDWKGDNEQVDDILVIGIKV